MPVVKTAVTYHLTSKRKVKLAGGDERKEEVNMDLEVSPNGDVTIKPAWPGKGEHFKFQNSSPDLVEHIANQLLKAVAIARKEKF